MNSTLRLLRHAVLLGTWAGLAALPLSAADPRPSPEPAPAAADPTEQAAQPESGLTFDFPGGTVASLLEMLRKGGGTPFNLIGEKEDLSLPLPPLSVRNAAPGAIVNAIGGLLQPHGIRVLDRKPSERGRFPVFVLMRIPGYVKMPTSALVCFDTRSFERKPDIAAVIDAIESAWRLDPQHNKQELRIQFHPGTGLLLVSGSGDACATATQIVGNWLPAKPAAKPAGDAAPQKN